MADNKKDHGSKKSLISELEERFEKHESKETLRLLYNYISTHENMGISAAKALINIVAHEKPDKELQKSAISFIEVMFEDKMKNNNLQKSEYYIDKVLAEKNSKDSEEISR